ncbi:hypothetical protein [Bacillus horti]|uniref:Uncharacterized protein n=1 Tax=Caldalkalibacillus horti TaxID=77523 RepID=A0ABT9W073_9BACI|nr:hypothetical protein [Bacillus horti]MDQ0166634.1 hypothetical protein [Bacillus horti]
MARKAVKEKKLVEKKPESAAKQERKKASEYSKQQFLESTQFTQHKDLLGALLEEGKSYRVAQVQQMITSFLKKEAN